MILIPNLSRMVAKFILIVVMAINLYILGRHTADSEVAN
jgi:hypothetical protein